MVRLNKESLKRIDELVESQLVKSRSEAAAFLIGEGIQRRHGLFDRIAQKVENIRKAKEELHNLLSKDESLEHMDADASNPS
jgi:metal-responsive CopG/Arc/MetJ family transcriptional regulator